MNQNISIKKINCGDFAFVGFYFKNKSVDQFEALNDELYQLMYENKVQAISCFVFGDLQYKKTWLKKQSKVFGDQQFIQVWQHSAHMADKCSTYVFGLANSSVKTILGEHFVCKSFTTGNSSNIYLACEVEHKNQDPQTIGELFWDQIQTPLLLNGFKTSEITETQTKLLHLKNTASLDLKDEVLKLKLFQETSKAKTAMFYAEGQKLDGHPIEVNTIYNSILKSYLQTVQLSGHKEHKLQALLPEDIANTWSDNPDLWTKELQQKLNEHGIEHQHLIHGLVIGNDAKVLKIAKALFKAAGFPMAPLIFMQSDALSKQSPLALNFKWIKPN